MERLTHDTPGTAGLETGFNRTTYSRVPEGDFQKAVPPLSVTLERSSTPAARRSVALCLHRSRHPCEVAHDARQPLLSLDLCSIVLSGADHELSLDYCCVCREEDATQSAVVLVLHAVLRWLLVERGIRRPFGDLT